MSVLSEMLGQDCASVLVLVETELVKDAPFLPLDPGWQLDPLEKGGAFLCGFRSRDPGSALTSSSRCIGMWDRTQ